MFLERAAVASVIVVVAMTGEMSPPALEAVAAGMFAVEPVCFWAPSLDSALKTKR
jgi:hypothetical protein